MKVIAWITCALSVCLSLPVAAQSSWPSKPITLVIATSAGGFSDEIGRILAQELGAKLGTSVVIENRVGAGSSIGMAYVSKAAPDGYTIGMANVASHAINPAVRPTNYPFDPVRSFAPVSMVGFTQQILYVNAEKVSARTVPEFIAYVKANPGKVTYGSSGTGSGGHLSMERLLKATGLTAVHVPYKGAAPMMTDLVGGHVLAALDAPTPGLQHVQGGKLRALGVATKERVLLAPELPPIADTVPDYNAKIWFGILAPPGTPQKITDRLSQEVQAIMQNPAALARFKSKGLIPEASTPSEFGKLISDEFELYKRMASELGITAE